MKYETVNRLRKIRTWVVIQKFTLSRGYIWCQSFMLGIIFAASIKIYVPTIPFWMLVVGSLIVLYTIGWIDKKFKFLHEEQSYATITNPKLMSGLDFKK